MATNKHKAEFCPRVRRSTLNSGAIQNQLNVGIAATSGSRTPSPAGAKSARSPMQLSSPDLPNNHSNSKHEVRSIINKLFNKKPEKTHINQKQKALKVNVESYLMRSLLQSEEFLHDFTSLAYRPTEDARNSTAYNSRHGATAKKPEAATKSRADLAASVSPAAQTVNQTANFNFSEIDIDQLVTELYSEISLNETQQKLKAGLEEYLLKEVFNSDDSYDEYTLASTTDSEEDEEEEAVIDRRMRAHESGYFSRAVSSEPEKNATLLLSMDSSKVLFESWLIRPVKVADFLDKMQRREPLLISDRSSDHVEQLLTLAKAPRILNVPIYWNLYRKGQPVVIKEPQSFYFDIHEIVCGVQEYLRSLVHAELVYAPPQTEIARLEHADCDIMILQSQGQIHVKLYNEESTQIFDKDVVAGDCLYMPIGCKYTIHTSSSSSSSPSFHLVLKIARNNTYGQLFKELLPLVLKEIVATDPTFSNPLPTHAWQNLGTAFADCNTKERRAFLKDTKKMLTKLTQMLPSLIDDAFDKLGKKYQQQALPPNISEKERVYTVFALDDHPRNLSAKNHNFELTLDSNVRLFRRDILQLVHEEDKKHYIYHRVNNDIRGHQNVVATTHREYLNDAESNVISALLQNYPKFTKIANLPLAEHDEKLQLANKLWEHGLVMINCKIV